MCAVYLSRGFSWSFSSRTAFGWLLSAAPTETLSSGDKKAGYSTRCGVITFLKKNGSRVTRQHYTRVHPYSRCGSCCFQLFLYRLTHYPGVVKKTELRKKARTGILGLSCPLGYSSRPWAVGMGKETQRKEK